MNNLKVYPYDFDISCPIKPSTRKKIKPLELINLIKQQKISNENYYFDIFIDNVFITDFSKGTLDNVLNEISDYLPENTNIKEQQKLRGAFCLTCLNTIGSMFDHFLYNTEISKENKKHLIDISRINIWYLYLYMYNLDLHINPLETKKNPSNESKIFYLYEKKTLNVLDYYFQHMPQDLEDILHSHAVFNENPKARKRLIAKYTNYFKRKSTTLRQDLISFAQCLSMQADNFPIKFNIKPSNIYQAYNLGDLTDDLIKNLKNNIDYCLEDTVFAEFFDNPTKFQEYVINVNEKNDLNNTEIRLSTSHIMFINSIIRFYKNKEKTMEQDVEKINHQNLVNLLLFNFCMLECLNPPETKSETDKYYNIIQKKKQMVFLCRIKIFNFIEDQQILPNEFEQCLKNTTIISSEFERRRTRYILEYSSFVFYKLVRIHRLGAKIDIMSKNFESYLKYFPKICTKKENIAKFTFNELEKKIKNPPQFT